MKIHCQHLKKLTIFNRLHKQGNNDYYVLPCPDHLKTDIETVQALWTEHKYNLPVNLNQFNKKVG